MKITRLNAMKQSVEHIECTLAGIVGDKEREPERQLTLLPEGVRQRIDAGEWAKGFCSVKFYENVTIEDLPEMTPGTVLRMGSLVLEISEASKHCYDFCDYVKEGTRCELPTNAYFAKVVEAGKASVGDDAVIL